MRRIVFPALLALGVLGLVALVGGVAVADGGLDVTVEQADDGSATVSVTENEMRLVNASVAVEAADNERYDGEGEYLTDENGTVSLPAPADPVNVTVTVEAANQTATTEAFLEPVTEEDNEVDDGANATFGQQVSAFVASLDSDDVNGPFGHVVVEFVHANSPAADVIPDHAGPPENGSQGPPDHAGPGGDGDEAVNETGVTTDSQDRTHADDDNRGPPADDERGPPSDDDSGPPANNDPGADDDEEDDDSE